MNPVEEQTEFLQVYLKKINRFWLLDSFYTSRSIYFSVHVHLTAPENAPVADVYHCWFHFASNVRGKWRALVCARARNQIIAARFWTRLKLTHTHHAHSKWSENDSMSTAPMD